MHIRPAKLSDISTIQNIYRYYAEETTISFADKVPDTSFFEEKIKQHGHGNFFFVIEEENDLLGFCYTSYYRPTVGYRYARELSIYLSHQETTKGLGQSLFNTLIEELERSDIRTLVSFVTSNNLPSIHFHKRNEFNVVGELASIGYKFNQFHDVLIFQRILNLD